MENEAKNVETLIENLREKNKELETKNKELEYLREKNNELLKQRIRN